MKNIKYLAAACSAFVLVGCNEMDTEPMGSTITSTQKEEVVAANPEMVSASVAGITAMFNQYANAIPSSFGHNDYGFASQFLLTDSRGMDLVSEDIGYNWYAASVTYNDLGDNMRTTYLIWNTMYNQIYAANQVAKIISPETDDATLKFYLAQALAIRAFDYFYLAQIYQQTYKGNESKPCVPIITNENADEAASQGCPRSTVQETYDQILKDLDLAISLLEGTDMRRSDKRYVDVAVAYGIRARVNLTMQNWAAAAADAQKAIEKTDATPYTIAQVSKPGFNDIKDNAWMWGILVEETDRVVTSGIVNFPSHMGSLNYGYASVGAWRRISKALFAQIPASDVRRGWWLDENGESVNLDAAMNKQKAAYSCPPYCQMKYGPYNGEMATSTNASDIPLMRVEEMYLILAEAQAMSGNAATGAQTLESLIKQYRNPEYSCKASDAASVQNAVWFQRRIELWGEGLSWFDLMRLGKGVDRRGAGFQEAYIFNIPAGDPCLILRLPKPEIEGNQALSESDNNPQATAPKPVAE